MSDIKKKKTQQIYKNQDVVSYGDPINGVIRNKLQENPAIK